MSRTSGSIELVDYAQTTVTQPPNVHTKNNSMHSVDRDSQPINALAHVTDIEHLEPPDKRTTAIVLVTVVCVTMIGSMLSGVTAVALPTMARELHLAPSVLLWYLDRVFTQGDS